MYQRRRPHMNTMSDEENARYDARVKAVFAAKEMEGEAWHTGGNSALEYTEEQLSKAAELYDRAADLWEAIGNRTWEVRTCHNAAAACRLTLAAKRATSAIERATGTDK